MQKTVYVMAIALLLALCLAVPTALAADKPNILVIMGDDIGYWNLS
jgi:starvation-inducible outer membrane lipoprotein